MFKSISTNTVTDSFINSNEDNDSIEQNIYDPIYEDIGKELSKTLK
jgi:hypothetical protein